MALRDRGGTVATGPLFRVKAPPAVTNVTAVAGAVTNATQVGVGGGVTVRVSGSGFESGDVVLFGAAEVTLDFNTADRIDFTTPSSAPGMVDVSVRDVLDDEATVEDAFEVIGFVDSTATRSPGSNATDDLGAVAAAIGDVDGDNKVDDVVLLGGLPGTRAEYARLLTGNASGVLVDVTGTKMPAASTDPNMAGFDGTAVALGDIDGNPGPELVIAGRGYYDGATNYYQDGVRVLANDGTGTFTFSATLTRQPSTYYYLPYIMADDEGGDSYQIGTVYSPGGTSNAIAIGDLDDDGDNEVVVGTSFGLYAYLYVDPSVIDWGSAPYYGTNNDLTAGIYGGHYLSATRILDNEGQLVDRTLSRFDGPAGSPTSTSPANVARDIALGDVDGQDGLDIVITWDDPLTVSVYGQYSNSQYGSSSDVARVATRILLNDGDGFFSDGTANWLTAAANNEFWQGHALELVDITGDAKLDLVLLHDKGPSVGRSALRILRNDGASTGFTDVTTNLLPPVTATETFSGSSLAVRDVNGDGKLDILIGTTRSVLGPRGTTARSTRLLLGTDTGTFVFGAGFLEAAADDSGETEFILLGDLEGASDPVLILGGGTTPTNSTNGDKLRTFDWTD